MPHGSSKLGRHRCLMTEKSGPLSPLLAKEDTTQRLDKVNTIPVTCTLPSLVLFAFPLQHHINKIGADNGWASH